MSKKLIITVLAIIGLSALVLGDEESSKDESSTTTDLVAKTAPNKSVEEAEKTPVPTEQELKPLNLKQKIKVNSNISLPQDI